MPKPFNLLASFHHLHLPLHLSSLQESRTLLFPPPFTTATTSSPPFFRAHPQSPPAHKAQVDGTCLSPGPTKPSTPKRFCPGEDLVEDIPTGITGLEANPTTASTSSSHPIPLFRSIPAHVAAQSLASTVVASSLAPSGSSTSSAYAFSPSASARIITESALFHPSPTGIMSHLSPSPSALLSAVVSPGTACAVSGSPALLLCASVSPCASGAPPLLTVSVSPCPAGAS